MILTMPCRTEYRALGLLTLLTLALILSGCGGGSPAPVVAPPVDDPVDPGPQPEPPPLPPPPQTELWPLFEDVTAQAGITATHGDRSDIPPDYYLTGQAWGDVDGDRLLDLYVTDRAGPNTLYRNRGDGTFDVSPYSATLALAQADSGSAIFIDYDNDGWKDLYVLNRGPNVLFRNLAGAGFQDVTSTAGIGDDDISMSAAWGDYDQDGYLDLYVPNWGPRYEEVGFPGEIYIGMDRLYHNEGDGTFTEVSDLLDTFLRTGYGYMAAFVDYDDDGDPDLYLVNDKAYEGDPFPGRPNNRNVLWRNDGAGPQGWVFTEIAIQVGADARLASGMGLTIGDYDGDLDLDFYCTNIGDMALLVNLGDGSFDWEWESNDAGVNSFGSGWGCVFADFDLDGWLDLYVAHVNAASDVFLNQGDGTFLDISDQSGADNEQDTLGVSCADYDRDGWLDLAVGEYDSGYRLYRNRGWETGRTPHVLVVRLVGDGPVNCDAIGGRVFVTRTDGLVMMQEVVGSSSLGSGNDLALHFGLADARVESMRVVWPDGLVQDFEEVPVDMEILIRYPTD